MDGIIGTMTANEAQIEGTGEKVNLFDYHVKADTILFQYTTPDGRNEMVKFPLAGFCENYLMQFASSSFVRNPEASIVNAVDFDGWKFNSSAPK